MASTMLQKAKMGLCQQLTGCDGPFLLPCGKKSDNPEYCESWKKVPIKKKEVWMEGEEIHCSAETLKRIEKEFGTPE